jgi:hypothetical protein
MYLTTAKNSVKNAEIDDDTRPSSSQPKFENGDARKTRNARLFAGERTRAYVTQEKRKRDTVFRNVYVLRLPKTLTLSEV